jgi:hypothetical protein
MTTLETLRHVRARIEHHDVGLLSLVPDGCYEAVTALNNACQGRDGEKIVRLSQRERLEIVDAAIAAVERRT